MPPLTGAHHATSTHTRAKTQAGPATYQLHGHRQTDSCPRHSVGSSGDTRGRGVPSRHTRPSHAYIHDGAGRRGQGAGKGPVREWGAPALPWVRWVTSGRGFHVSGPQFAHLQNGDGGWARCLTQLSWSWHWDPAPRRPLPGILTIP